MNRRATCVMRMPNAVGSLGILLSLVASSLTGAVPSVVAADSPRSTPSRVHTDEVCFNVHNEGDPQPSALYGVRYYSRAPRPETKTIVLVHGVSPTHEYWDVRPDFSIARNLATAGYLVITYDRLGWGRSPYRRPQGGRIQSLSGARAMLHEVVGEVKTATYTSAIGGACPADGGPVVGPATRTVIIVGTSAGGGMVSGYPGLYHDVAAAIQIGWTNQGFSPAFTAYTAETLAHQDTSGQDHIRFIPDEESCKKVVLFVPGVLSTLLPTYCKDGYGPAAPNGEVTFVGRLVAENLAAIPRVGPGLPVLLVFADHDFLFTPDESAAEFGYWKSHCGCDVETWTQADSGHALAAHRSMPTFTAKVVDWLAAKGLGAVA